MTDTSDHGYPAPAPLVPAPVWQGTPAPQVAPAPLAALPGFAPAPPQEAAPKAAEPAPKKERMSRAAALTAHKAVIRKTANKAQEILDADPADVALLRAVLGVAEGIADLTTAVMTASKADVQVIADAISIMDADPYEAGVVAATLDSRLRTVWRFFAELGVVASEMPASEVKAAIALARSVHESDQDIIRARVTAMQNLLKK